MSTQVESLRFEDLMAIRPSRRQHAPQLNVWFYPSPHDMNPVKELSVPLFLTHSPLLMINLLSHVCHSSSPLLSPNPVKNTVHTSRRRASKGCTAKSQGSRRSGTSERGLNLAVCIHPPGGPLPRALNIESQVKSIRQGAFMFGGAILVCVR